MHEDQERRFGILIRRPVSIPGSVQAEGGPYKGPSKVRINMKPVLLGWGVGVIGAIPIVGAL